MNWNPNIDKMMLKELGTRVIFLKIKGLEQKSQTVKIDDNCDLIEDIGSNFSPNNFSPRELFEKYKGREVFAEYLSKSRIDGFPMFRIDTLALDRDDKISQILN